MTTTMQAPINHPAMIVPGATQALQALGKVVRSEHSPIVRLRRALESARGVSSREEDQMQRGVKVAVALGSTLVLLSGCGGSSSSDQTAKFKTSYKSAITPLRQLSQEIGGAIEQASSKTDAQLGATFQQLAGRWQNQLTQLKSLKPPSSVASDFSTVTDAATRVESDLNALVAAAGSHSSTAASQAVKSVITDVTAAKSASTAITDKLGIK